MTNPFEDDEPTQAGGNDWPTEETTVTDNPDRARVTDPDKAEGLRWTFKTGSGHADPWLGLDAPNASNMYRLLSDPVLKDVIEHGAKVGRYVQKVWNDAGGSAQPAQASGGSAPAATPGPGPTEAPGGEKQYCKHGEKRFDTKVSRRTNKPYSAFFCTGPQNDSCGITFPQK